MKYTEPIIKAAKKTWHDGKGREYYYIPYNAYFVIVRLYRDENGERSERYCEYQRQDDAFFGNPVLMVPSTPRFIYETFVNLPIRYDPMMLGRVSANYIKKIKAKKFSAKDNIYMWIDKDGYIYHADKYGHPTLKQMNEDKKIGERHYPEAVFGWWFEGEKKQERWFDNEVEFNTFIDKIDPPSPFKRQRILHGIKRKGRHFVPSGDRLNVFVMPYLDIDKELSLQYNKDKDYNIARVAHIWSEMSTMQSIEIYERLADFNKTAIFIKNDRDFCEKIIRRYLEAKERGKIETGRGGVTK